MITPLTRVEAARLQVVRELGRSETELHDALTRRHGLGLSDYRALTVLAAAADGELRMTVLADTLGLNQSSVTRLVQRLERSGFCVRDLCPNDGRGVYAVITLAGRAAAADARPVYLARLAAGRQRARTTGDRPEDERIAR